MRPAEGRPVFVGFGGGSASGKTTVVLRLKRLLSPLRVEVVHQDHFYRRGRTIPRFFSPSQGGWRADYNNGKSYRWAELIRFCRRLRGGDVVLLEGLMVLYRPELRKLMDLRVFVTCPERERLRRRLRRGVPGWDVCRHRLYWRECVQPGFRRYVRSTRRYADLALPAGEGSRQRLGEELRRLARWIRSRVKAGRYLRGRALKRRARGFSREAA